MFPRRIRRALSRIALPLVGWASAGIYLLVACGVPLPLPTATDKDVSQPFPCMNRSCGCRDAEQCWSNCCCHTPAERIAWAKAIGVKPPAAMEVCQAETPRPCCVRTGRLSDQSKPDAKPVADSNSAADPATTAERVAPSTLIVIRALECRGLGGEWLAALIAVPPAPVAWQFHLPPSNRAIATAPLASSPADPPPVPPPRTHVA